MNDPTLFQNLCQAQIEGSATDDQRRQLADLLETSEEARHAYVEQMRIHALLTWQHGVPLAAVPAAPAENGASHSPWRRRVLAMAAILILSASGIWWWSASVRPMVHLEIMASSGTGFKIGEQIHRRTLELEHGTLKFRMDSGAVVDLRGPAMIELFDAMHLRVLSGIVTADISTGTKGFIIDTAQARIVDLGTRFSVSAESSSATDIVVFEGEVEVFAPSGKITPERPKITLTEGDAIRVRPANSPSRLKMVPLRPDASSVDDGKSSNIITGIEDNVAEPEFRGYYGLVRGSFGEGARTYTNGHTRTWHAMPGGTFPEEMLGADGICTFDSDRKNPDLRITLSVSRACDIYVMADARAAAPAWLKTDFVDTGYLLRSGPFIPRGTPKEDFPKFYENEANYVPYTVWKRRVQTPGEVTLGSPLERIRQKAPVMYGIAVKAVP